MPEPAGQTRGVAVVGSANMDLTGVAARLPAAGETVLGSHFLTGVGGKGANQAVACARLGVPTRFIGRVGDDGFGRQIAAALRDEGVDVAALVADERRPTGVALIMVGASGENSILVAPGANMALSAADVATALADTATGIVLAQLEVPLPAVRQAAECARREGTQVVLNPAPAQELLPQLLALVDVITPNERELAGLCGMAIADEDDIRQAARQLLDRGPRAVVVTLGSAGCLVVSERLERLLPAPRVRVVDTTGAGDAFSGGLAVALLAGYPLVAAATYANATGALATTELGAQAGLPTRAAVEALLAEQIPDWANAGD
ncbi:MAG: ribokinase [Chloroflexota bacterium]